MERKELEAFQTMSAFLIHDLKNAASTLGLMLENLPTHFDNPAFRRGRIAWNRECGQPDQRSYQPHECVGP